MPMAATWPEDGASAASTSLAAAVRSEWTSKPLRAAYVRLRAVGGFPVARLLNMLAAPVAACSGNATARPRGASGHAAGPAVAPLRSQLVRSGGRRVGLSAEPCMAVAACYDAHARWPRPPRLRHAVRLLQQQSRRASATASLTHTPARPRSMCSAPPGHRRRCRARGARAAAALRAPHIPKTARLLRRMLPTRRCVYRRTGARRACGARDSQSWWRHA